MDIDYQGASSSAVFNIHLQDKWLLKQWMMVTSNNSEKLTSFRFLPIMATSQVFHKCYIPAS